MEARFGHDFSRVRVHLDSTAGDSARAAGAVAYTAGSDVVFQPGAYAPHTPEGRRLIAHELAHVVQQSRAGSSSRRSDSAPGDRWERAAAWAADRATSVEEPARSVGETFDLLAGGSGPVPMLQRQEASGRGRLVLRPPPLLARSMGSLTVDGFAVNSAAPTGDHRRRLVELARTLRELLESYPAGTVRVVGHTDATASEAHNERLGQRRADAVTTVLQAEGVPAQAFVTESAGESAPSVPTEGPEPRNRRVDISFEPTHRLVPRLFEFTPPALRPPTAPTTPPRPVELFPPLRPPDINRPETPEETARRIFRPIPEVRARDRSFRDRVFEAVDRALNPVMRDLGVPERARGLIRDGYRAAIDRASEAALEAALDQTTLGDTEKRAIREAFRAAVRTSGR